MLSPISLKGQAGGGVGAPLYDTTGPVYMGGLNVPAYPAFPVSGDFADHTATNVRPVESGCGCVVDPVVWVAAAGAGLYLLVTKLRGA